MTLYLPPGAILAVAGSFLALDAIHFGLGALAAARAGKPRLALWAPALKIYFPMATIAAWIGLWETLSRPHYWHKTTHGIFPPTNAKPDAPAVAVTAPAAAPHRHPAAAGFRTPG